LTIAKGRQNLKKSGIGRKILKWTAKKTGWGRRVLIGLI